MDFFITDTTVSLRDDDYTEKLLRLPELYFPNSHNIAHPLDISNLDKNRLKILQGLPTNQTVYCNMQGIAKISSSSMKAWLSILKAHENSVIWLLEPRDLAKRNIWKRAKEFNVDVKRIYFAAPNDPDDHIRRVGACDLFLDSFEYNAHSTGADALWAGVPLLTITSGKKPCSRVGFSMLKSIGLETDLAVPSVKDFIDRAIQLGNDSEQLFRIRSKLVENRDKYPMFDIKRYTRLLEQGFRSATEYVEKGTGVHTFSVSPPELPVRNLREEL